MKSILFSAISFSLAAPGALAAVWSSGHGDIELIYDGASWETAFLLSEAGEPPAIVDGAPVAPETELEVGEISLRVLGPPQPGAGLGDSGAAEVFLLPQDEVLAASLGNPFAGFAVDEISPGIFLNDLISLQLVSVNGPGVFSLWETDPFGAPNVLMSSAQGSSVPDAVDLTLDPGHFHFNVGFSEAGIYDVTYRSEGELAAGGMTGNTFTIRYDVVPEPGSLALLGVAGFLLVRRRR